MNYEAFISRKTHEGSRFGFAPTFMPDYLFPFQAALAEWSIRKGRAAIFADCGLGKTPMALCWAENVVRHTNRPVLVLTPIAVGIQMLSEGRKFGIECARSRDGTLAAGARVVITNYEQLHHFAADSFGGVVCDESSILKHFSGATQKAVTRFMAKVPYRLLCTATAAPNDYTELGTSSEALGYLGYSDMLSRFFRQSDNQSHRMQQIKEQKAVRGGGAYFAKLAFRAAQQIGQWRLKGHAETPFWRWVASWARACRKPSDLGFDDGPFVLPPICERTHTVSAARPPDGMLFTLPAFGLGEEREERRRTLNERCECAAGLARESESAIVWVHLNDEGNLVERLLPDSVQVAGADSDEAKEEKLMAFMAGQARVLVTKAKIAGFGLNLQRCAHVVTFATHSYESYYQSVRRCWRFGQTRPVTVDLVVTEGERRVADNMARKSAQASEMFERMIAHMNDAMTATREVGAETVEVPAWL